MSTLLIEGGRRLSGSVDVEGNKNAALPLLAACLLTTQECVLTNVPRITDVEVMARLLLDLGAEVEGIGSTTLRVRCREVVKDEPDSALVCRLRGSVLLIGPLLARRGRARLAQPGGDFPARRTITTHLDAIESMGARITPSAGHDLEVPDGLKPTSIYLHEASVTGTETALLAAAADSGPGRKTSRSSRRSSSACRASARWTATRFGSSSRGQKLPAGLQRDCGRDSRAIWSASSRCWRRSARGKRSSMIGCTSCACSRSNS